MKRLVAAVLFIAIALGSSIWCYSLTVERTVRLSEVLENEKEMFLKTEKAVPERTKIISDEWENHEELLVAMLPHDELEEIEIDIMKLYACAEQDVPDEYLEALNDCINRLNHIRDTEAFAWRNIF
ncbi:MAG: DUF4363 family protein [Clostridia bacterium]|nr:DUF4363 family protein [Clostridia bacterium]